MHRHIETHTDIHTYTHTQNVWRCPCGLLVGKGLRADGLGEGTESWFSSPPAASLPASIPLLLGPQFPHLQGGAPTVPSSWGSLRRAQDDTGGVLGAKPLAQGQFRRRSLKVVTLPCDLGPAPMGSMPLPACQGSLCPAVLDPPEEAG